MKKIFLVLATVGLLAASCNKGTQAVPANETSDTNQTQQTQQTQVYTNSEYNFQFSYPSSWTKTEGAPRNQIFTFKTRDGHDVELLMDKFGPMELSDPFKSKHPTVIGKESGLIDSSYHCGDGSVTNATCTGTLIFESKQMSAKGFSLEFHILGVDRSASLAKEDPYDMFNADVKDIENILSTFQFNS